MAHVARSLQFGVLSGKKSGKLLSLEPGLKSFNIGAEREWLHYLLACEFCLSYKTSFVRNGIIQMHRRILHVASFEYSNCTCPSVCEVHVRYLQPTNFILHKCATCDASMRKKYALEYSNRICFSEAFKL